jgi:hypothetical protein
VPDLADATVINIDSAGGLNFLNTYATVVPPNPFAPFAFGNYFLFETLDINSQTGDAFIYCTASSELTCTAANGAFTSFEVNDQSGNGNGGGLVLFFGPGASDGLPLVHLYPTFQ